MRATMFATLALSVLVFFSNGKCNKEGLKMDNSNNDSKITLFNSLANGVKNKADEKKDSTTGVFTVIHEAVRLNQLEIVKLFIERGYDVNLRDGNGCTLLFYAIQGSHDVNNKLQMMEYLIDKGADLKAKAKTGATVLHIAALYGNVKIAEFFLDKGANLNARDNEGLTPLDYAEGNTVHVDDNTDGVTTVIHVAVERNQLEVVKLFIEEEGYDVNLRDQDGCTLLFYAVTSPHDIKSKLQMMEYLIDKGADLKAKAKTGATVLHIAARYGDVRIVKFLYEKGADIYAKDNEGLTPLDYAEGNTVHVDDITDGIKTAVHVAVESNQFEVVKSFIEEEGYDVNLRDQDGRTLLFYAVTGPHDTKSKLQMMKYLIEKGADVNAATKTGATVLHIAAGYGDVKILKFLLDLGADANAIDSEGLASFLDSVREEKDSIHHKNSAVTDKTIKIKSSVDTNARDNEELKTLDNAEGSGRLDTMKHEL